ncbi:Aste57867_12820 [Aphanomyces stellatus]|uniref:Aste57867_12820 protein n=1 Tax=Aphanomyces stellatus TaxID=120398 RepID=A0A485KWL6_9STRA|nr:hypothetical protein As57867_012772 [Aphanomyces stellatus]VFT89667.1 Aste57867_12820 [Aphanomyces stellatus]
MDNGDRAKRLKALRDARNKKEGIAVEEEQVVAVDKVADAVSTADKSSIDDEATKAAADDEPAAEEVLSIAPKKPTWDLERGLEKQMKKLERRTQNAMVEILREKMEREMQDDDGSDDDEDEEGDES